MTTPSNHIPPEEIPGFLAPEDDEKFVDGPMFVSDEDELHNKLDAILAAQEVQAAVTEGIRVGVNTIGTMMNEVAEAFGKIMEEIQKGGIAGLLGGMMGGKKNA